MATIFLTNIATSIQTWTFKRANYEKSVGVQSGRVETVTIEDQHFPLELFIKSGNSDSPSGHATLELLNGAMIISDAAYVRAGEDGHKTYLISSLQSEVEEKEKVKEAPPRNLIRMEPGRRQLHAARRTNAQKRAILRASEGTMQMLGPGGENPHLIEGTKRFIFNETGNIMVSTTTDGATEIEQSVRDCFNEVSVFFAAMTRAITTTPIPNDPQNRFYSLYNYDALMKVIGGSGLFIHCTQEDIRYKSSSFGADFSKELIQGMLGLPAGAGSLGFASALIATMGEEIHVGGSSSTGSQKVAHIVFVCEYLMGMPVISAVVVYVEMNNAQQAIAVGPCFKEESKTVEMITHKDTYLFVTPTFIHEYAPDLISITSDKAYADFIDYLKNILTPSSDKPKPQITGLKDADNADIDDTTALPNNKSCTIVGTGFGEIMGRVKLGTSDSAALKVVSWHDKAIVFNGYMDGNKATAPAATKITVTTPDNATASGAKDHTMKVPS